jgi:hypothetical protein
MELFTTHYQNVNSSLNFHRYVEYPQCGWSASSAGFSSFCHTGNLAAASCANASFPSEDYRNALIAAGEACLSYQFPAIPATLFLEFTQTGNRSRFEALYFEKRRALNALVLAECAEASGRFLPAVINGVVSLCEESAWQLPAHNSYARSAPQLPLPDVTRPVLDLFACETGAQLAMIHYLLKKQLDAVSPFLDTRICRELTVRILIPYLNSHFWWMGNGDEPMCNWTAWCTQNVLLTFFSMQGEEFLPFLSANATDYNTLCKQVVKQACYSLDCFLKDYGDDGCCNEGAQYYHHAGLCLFGAMKILDHVTDGAFSPLFQNDKIKNIALYIANMHVDDIYYVNFSDCSPIAGRCGVREYLFGKATNQPTLMQLAADDYRKTDDRLNLTEINLFYRVMAAFADSEILSCPTKQDFHKKDLYYGSVGIFLARDSRYTLAVKAGCNDDSHNHNDTGSITVYANGKPLLIDVGVETYTQKTFSSQRYEIWTMQSSYHNLPEINHTMQKDGRAYAARDVQVTLTPDAPTISLDIASAYPKEAAIGSYRRTVTLRKNSHIEITDCFDVAPESIVLFFLTYEIPEILQGTQNDAGNIAAPSGTFPTVAIGSLAKLHFLTAVSLSVEEIPITDARLATAWKHSIYRLRIRPQENQIRVKID